MNQAQLHFQASHRSPVEAAVLRYYLGWAVGVEDEEKKFRNLMMDRHHRFQAVELCCHLCLTTEPTH